MTLAGLEPHFDNVADFITVKELIASGHLSDVRAFHIDVENELTEAELEELSTGEGNLKRKIPKFGKRHIKHIREKAPGRQTVVFTRLVQEAERVVFELRREGLSAVLVHSKLRPPSELTRRMQSFKSGESQV